MPMEVGAYGSRVPRASLDRHGVGVGDSARYSQVYVTDSGVFSAFHSLTVLER